MTVPTTTITISQDAYEALSRRAAETNRTVSEVADELLQPPDTLTEHPYIVRREGFRGGRLILRGTSMPVWLIAAFWKSGDTMDASHYLETMASELAQCTGVHFLVLRR